MPADGPRGPENVILSTPRAQQTRRRARRWAERAGECYFVDAPSTANEDRFEECGLVGAPSTVEEDCLCLPCTPPGLSSSRCCRGTPLVPAAGTLGPDSVRLAEGAGGLLVDAPTLVEPVLCRLVCQHRRRQRTTGPDAKPREVRHGVTCPSRSPTARFRESLYIGRA